MGMKIIDTKIAGLKIVEATPIADQRGSFSRWFCTKELSPLLGGRIIEQINHSKTLKAGCIRGMHFQKPPHAERKFVRCIAGRLLDVALDLRQGSPTFLQYHAEELTPSNNRMLVLPEGFAHGFQALEDNSELLYFNTASYEQSAEGGIHYADPMAGITWPLPPVDVSDKDRAWAALDSSFKGFNI
jgi:dTDP-4-dehydrorhamnose 3,5-epimerase